MITINRESSTPIYLQLYEQIMYSIKNGFLKPGDTLMPTRVLAKELGISRNTVEQAYSELIQEGIVFSRRGSGYKVNAMDTYTPSQSKYYPPTISAHKKNEYLFDFNWYSLENNIFRQDYYRQCLVNACRREENKSVLRYPERQGLYDLRCAFSRAAYLYRDVPSTPDNVIVTSDRTHVLSTVCSLFPKDTPIILCNPSFPSFSEVFRRLSREVIYVDIVEDGIDIDALYKYEKALIFVSPIYQFPSCVTMSEDNRRRLLKWAEDTDSYIIEDDNNSELFYGPNPPKTLSAMDTNNRVFYSTTLSIIISPSSQVAFLILLPQFMEIYRKNFTHFMCVISDLVQYTIAEYIDEKHLERHVRRIKTHSAKKNALLIQSIEKYFGPTAKIIGGESELFLKLSPQNNMSEDELIAAAKNVGVHLYSINEFYFNGKKPEPNFVCIGYGNVPLADIDKGVGLLYKAWQK